ncbi:amino acid ABC transporter permease [Mesorhizobium sp. ES1-4]|uniref:amino acid ABC transporter permease n=1 Tax=Mesorhizobium sp. ES1-4 TaxID=2876627 RepID=UPI001CCB1B21|nr:amino acid ABC transporter permease [Mesorhizobium sp. ES1-4]MBZ9798434.1 amino acid ABC transporter permease [Mesorhizobium sp. ES1-4]
MNHLINDYIEWWPQLWAGLQLTVGLTFASMAVALAIAITLALGQIHGAPRWARICSVVFVELIRGTPLLLQLFYIFYVLPYFGIKLSPIVAGIAGLSINYGAYLSEVFRAGIEAVDRGQWEASRALGMRSLQFVPLVILPQAARIVLPPTGNYFISMFKDTALVSTISLGDLMFRGQLIASETFSYIKIYSFIFLIYLAISYPASRAVVGLERYLRRGRNA